MNFYIFSISKALVVLALLSHLSVFSQVTDSSRYYTISSIEITGNKKTKNHIIIRELVKKQNDSVQLKNIAKISERSELNMFNTGLFIYDSLTYKINHNLKTIDYTIKVKERWYVWPIPYISFLDRNVNAWLVNKNFNSVNYGLALSIDNFTGSKDRLIVLFRTGYANQFGFNYRFPYLNKKQTIGAYAQYVYNEYNKLHYITTGNKQQFIADANTHLRTDHAAKLGVFYRPKLFLQHALDIHYNNFSILKELNYFNYNYFSNGATLTDYLSVQYKLTYDDRDNKIYPLSGNVIELNVIKDGLDFTATTKLNTVQGLLTLKKHFPITSRINFASQIKARYLYSEKSLPFAFNQALGYYNNYIRGYEYSVIDGQNFALTKNSLRLQLIRPKFHKVDALKKLNPFNTIPFYLYANVYYDGAYVHEEYYTETNPLANSWQHGYGVGLDFVTYYDFIVRLEYSFNKQNQSGIFLHLTSGF